MGNELKHYGTPRKSGRYPWGSGKEPFQSMSGFVTHIAELKKQGLSEVQIARGLGMTTTQLRARQAIASADIRANDVALALKLKEKGMSNVAIGKQMGINESSVRSLLDPAIHERKQMISTTADILKKEIEDKKYIDIGLGVENHMGISRNKLLNSVALLEEMGYKRHYLEVDQLGTGNKTSLYVLTKDDVTWSEVNKNKDKIGLINHYTEDGGRTYLGLEPVKNVDSKKVYVRYAEEGGSKKDGVIELRPGVDDISLGNSKYAQVRIGVDGTHYLKGMAIHTDDIPEGYDIVFNTNKSKDTPKMDTLKSMKDDVDNPFGATVRQKHYTDKNGKKQLSSLNIVNEEGDWSKWSRTVSSQMLSKQRPSTAKKQLDLAKAIREDELNDILELTNPTVKQKLLDTFSNGADKASETLKAAAMPRQASHVILPVNDISDKEIYAPNYRNGEKVVLIRYPHGGIFEIPELTVNNKNKTAKKIMGNAPDAVGINHKVAERLSGADFDGDTVLVIPNNQGAVKTSSALKGLKNFDPQQSYPLPKDAPKMSAATKGRQMGDVSNLITDMTIKGASQDEIARAVRHSMVVIDAEKHHLDYKKSAVDNGIPALKKKYQGRENAGASTLISKSESEARPRDRKTYIDKNTGKKVHVETGKSYVNSKGKTVYKTTKSTKMAETDDAHTLSSGTVIENIYANYANDMKALANKGRKEMLNTPNLKYSPSAKKTYSKEVASLDSKLALAMRNKPLERQAQLVANKVVDSKLKSNPHMDKDDVKRLKNQALNESRVRVGASKEDIKITPSEWEAIQAGAISHSKLVAILDNTDLDLIKEYATPRKTKTMSASKISRAKAMASAGHTQAEIADALGVSASTISDILS